MLPSCYPLGKFHEYEDRYPVGSAWIYYYNTKTDSSIVYIDHIDLIQGIVIRNTEFRNDTTIIGYTHSAFLYPIKGEREKYFQKEKK